MFCLAGLGNPGREYAGNRHNAGRLLVEFLAGAWNAVGAGKKSDCDLHRAVRKDREILLARPRAYMNVSGPPLVGLLKSCNIPLERFLLIHDDIDFPVGRLQLKRGGSAAGHHGVESVYETLGSSDFHRLRIGVGRPNRSTKDYVLSDFTAGDMGDLERVFEKSVEGLDFWIDGHPSRAAQILNTVSANPLA